MKIWISLFAVLCFANFARAQAPVEPVDVPQDNPAYNDLQILARHDLVPAPREGFYTYFPYMTRYEFAIKSALILSNIYEQNDPNSENIRFEKKFRVEKSYREVFEKHPEVAASLVRLLKEFSPEIQQFGFGFSAMQIKFAQIELTAGRVNTLRDGRESTPSFKSPVAAPFRDVPKTHWAFEAVEKLRQSGIIIGTPDGAFAK